MRACHSLARFAPRVLARVAAPARPGAKLLGLVCWLATALIVAPALADDFLERLQTERLPGVQAAQLASAQPSPLDALSPAPLQSQIDDLEQMVRQQQAQVDMLQQQLTIATTPVPPPPPKPYTVGSQPRMDGAWNYGLEFRSPNRDFYVHIGGRVQWDSIWLNSRTQRRR
jgi:hypothetical protein